MNKREQHVKEINSLSLINKKFVPVFLSHKHNIATSSCADELNHECAFGSDSVLPVIQLMWEVKVITICYRVYKTRLVSFSVYRRQSRERFGHKTV